MTGWDVLDRIMTSFPPIAMAMLLVVVIAAVIVFVIGFARHGIDFVKHGLKQNFVDELMTKLATKEDIARLDAKLDANIARLDTQIGRIDTKLEVIETNHFGHLKNYLGILNGVLLDKKIIDNEIKARLDNELRGM